VHHAGSAQTCVLQARNSAGRPASCLRPLKLVWEAHQIPKPGASRIFLAQLHHRVGPPGSAHLAIEEITPARIPEPIG